MANGQKWNEWPEDGLYRGFPIPKRLKQNWNNVSGRWWKDGVDTVLDSEAYEAMEESAWRYNELSDE